VVQENAALVMRQRDVEQLLLVSQGPRSGRLPLIWAPTRSKPPKASAVSFPPQLYEGQSMHCIFAAYESGATATTWSIGCWHASGSSILSLLHSSGMPLIAATAPSNSGTSDRPGSAIMAVVVLKRRSGACPGGCHDQFAAHQGLSVDPRTVRAPHNRRCIAIPPLTRWVPSQCRRGHVRMADMAAGHSG
jgi:hypothetical protein